ncbi:uncharacterized protein LOC110062138 [Orbicella faveolata]|uniref:uncharacterized protein LOC110062138 n=1 Tax=Orbicella faveolata TaxID=48498 RepID=UPI0009E620D4|nr:uncharacterized protein LOC110062138 [Orbicella faveolata]
MNYDFFYHVLEADDSGRQPKIEVATEVDEHGTAIKTQTLPNPKFNHKSLSCLRRIAESGNKEAVQHPVVRMLVSRKWNNFAHWWFCVQASFYILFLTLLSYALIHGSTVEDPNQYDGKADGLRLFCEIFTIIFLMFYFFEEVNQAEREWRTYFKDPYNYFDWLGLILTFLVIPLRFVEVDSQWSLAGLGYLFNFLRLFKFSCVTRTTGLYTKTLARIIYRDITRFSVVFVVVFLGFCGAMYMALKATGSQELFSCSLCFSVQASFYILFLTLLSYALIHGSTVEDPNQYNGKADGLRLFCEIFTIIFLMFYFFEEVNQAEREWRTYFKDPYNYFDWLGLILTFLVIPLRFVEVDSQWSLAGLGYLFNFLRLFKFSCVTRTTGLYTKTLARIIYRDITRFSVVFVVVFLGFCGAMYMALKATGSQELFSNYAWLMLAAVRALVEQQPAEEDYSKFNWLAILILLAYMAMVIVILLNILIAQLSYTYSEAKKTAKLQYAIDTMFIVTRLEYSRIARWNLRVKNYSDGDWVSEDDLAKEMLEYTDDRHPWETMEDRLTDIREIMRKVVRRGKDKGPWDSVDEKLTRLTTIIEKLPESKADTQ